MQNEPHYKRLHRTAKEPRWCALRWQARMLPNREHWAQGEYG